MVSFLARRQPLSAHNPASNGKRLVLMIGSFALFAAGMTLFEINFPHYLRGQFQMKAGFRSFLEFPRESQGFAVVFYAVLLGAVTERRLFALAATVTAAGMTALALLPARIIPDSITGLVPALPLIGIMMVHSAGMHLAGVMEQSIIIESGGLDGAGRRLGWVAFWRTIAALVAALAILAIGRVFDIGYRPYFLAGAGLCLSAVILIVAATRGQPSVRGTRRRLKFERKFNRFYLLCALFGVRKQVFITFGLWTLVTVYEQPLSTVALLWFLFSAAGLVTQPLIGAVIDRVGPRLTLTFDALILLLVCLLYGFAEHLFSASVAIIVVGATYVLDHLLFFAGSARSVYAGSVTSDQSDLSPTLSLGVTIDHVFSMSVPLAGGVLWKAFGYEFVFLAAALIAGVTAVVAAGIRTQHASGEALQYK